MNFYGWSLEYILWHLTSEQVFHWYEVCVAKAKGEQFGYPDESEDWRTTEEINGDFVWSEELNCWVGK